MIRILFTLIMASTVLLNQSTAQTLSVGPVLGGNFTKISGITNAKSLSGLNIGAFANYSINEHIGMGFKLTFSQKGTAVENSTGTVRLNYLQLPITGVYYFGSIGNSFRPKIFAGPYAGALISAKDNDGNDIVGVYKKADIGGLIGLGFNYSLKSRTWLNIDASYSGSLTNIAEAANTTYKNTGLSISAGLSFPISAE